MKTDDYKLFRGKNTTVNISSPLMHDIKVICLLDGLKTKEQIEAVLTEWVKFKKKKHKFKISSHQEKAI